MPAGLIPMSPLSVSLVGSLLRLCFGRGDQEPSTTADGLCQEGGEFQGGWAFYLEYS